MFLPSFGSTVVRLINVLLNVSGCCRELHEVNKSLDFSLYFFFSFFPWGRNEGLFSAYPVPTVTDAMGASRYPQPLELQFQQQQVLSSQGGRQECSAQQAHTFKCLFNLYTPWICQDSHLQQKVQSLPLNSGSSQEQILQMHSEMVCVSQPRALRLLLSPQ